MKIQSADIGSEPQIHRAGCSHLSRRGVWHVHPAEDHDDRLSVAEAEYGRSAGGFYEEGGGAAAYGSYHDFLILVATTWLTFAPCTKALPLEVI